MRATLIHNPNAGSAESEEDLKARIRDLGWMITHSLSGASLTESFFHGSDVVIVAGGDGTIGKVARLLAGTSIPLAIVPMGTANNVARSLEIGVDVDQAIAGLASAHDRAVDLGVITTTTRHSANAKELFVESFGMGVFAEMIGQKEAHAGRNKKLSNAINLIATELQKHEARHYHLEVDGCDRSGKYVLVAIMNMRSFGPALRLAPNARWDDGKLDVVLVGPESRDEIVNALRRGVNDGGVSLPGFEVTRAAHVRIAAKGSWTHADDRPNELDGEIAIAVAKGAVRVLVPPNDHGCDNAPHIQCRGVITAP